MATKANVDLNVNALPPDIRLPVRQIAYDILDDFALGVGDKAINGRFYRFTSTTAATANTEFSIVHGIGATPVQLIPVLTLSNVNEQLVNLTVSRAADTERVYLKSASTGVVFSCLLET